MKTEHNPKLDRTERSMIRWTSWVYLKKKECRIERTVGIGTSQFGD